MKKKGTRKIRKNKRTTQRRKNRSYKRMKGGVIKLPRWITPLKTSLDVNATRVISESLPILGFSTPVVMPTGDKLIEFRGACDEFIDMMQHNDKFHKFYDSNINSINPMFESLIMPAEFTHVTRYDDNIIELFKQGTIPNTAEIIESTLITYLRESNTQHRKYKKFNLLAFALFIMKIQKLNIFPYPLPPASQEIIDDINTRFEEILKYKWDDGLYNPTPLDSIQGLWKRMYNSLFYKNEIELLNDECKNYIIRLCGVVSNPSKSILLQALLYYEMLPTADNFREIYDKYTAGTASAEEIRQLTIALILIVTKLKYPKSQ